MLALAIVVLLCAAIPCALFCANLSQYREPPASLASQLPAVSILIPARNEAHGIAAAVQSVLASRKVQFEIVVMDDQSTDETTAIVTGLARQDERVRLKHSVPLPPGWNGKQHACWQLAQAARYPILCFVDADVRLEPDCIARMETLLVAGKNGLVSGFPRQVTGTFLEWLLLPLIHFVLLGFLPLARMRAGTDPTLAAGCGQFLMVNAEDYFRAGGHTGIKLTMHDGLRLPRLFREHGLRTDLADLTHLAQCRMYTSTAQVWSGLAKNATEGIAAPTRIFPISLILILGQVMPLLFLSLAVITLVVLAVPLGALGMDVHLTHPRTFSIELLAILVASTCAYLPRILSVRRFRQDWRSALLHPVGVTVLLTIQWYALARKLVGSPVSWKDRAYVSPTE